mgnify:CR=1 FL=1
MKLVEEYYKENSQKVIGSLARSLGTIQDAEDVFHTAIERAIKYREAYDPEKDYGGWFYGIMRRCIYEHYQQVNNRAAEEELDEFDFQGNFCQGSFEKIKRDAQRVYRDYPEEQRDIIHYYVVHGYRIVDIVAITAKSRSWVHKTIRKFQEEMRERYGRE